MQDRVCKVNHAGERHRGRYVLYWAQMNRRADANHGLAFAADLANRLDKPLLFYEGLTCSYPFASDRFHTFLLEGVPATARRLKELGIGYVFYLRRRRSDPDDIFYRLAADAAAVVADDYPTFVARQYNASVPAKLEVAYYVVDSSCVVPMSRHHKREYAAATLRPKIRRALPECLRPVGEIRLGRRWKESPPPFYTAVRGPEIPELVAGCEIDHSVRPSTAFRGGRQEALERLERFLRCSLHRYAELRNEPSAHATSRLSPYLHFGHISSLEVALAASSYARTHGISADAFLEELIVRRELAFNFVRHTADYRSLTALPEWARATLRRHAADRRRPVYDREAFEHAQTHDALWNATQKELRLRGVIQGYYRMYWGKKIIEWSATPEEALATMIYLHDRYALDGRDPNTYTNILWCFGLHDRPFAERPVFGKVRYMSLEGMRRKTDVAAYVREIEHLERTGEDPLRL